ncbi:MAG: 5-formyltetrahydrofolate cyclo-ligase [Flavobacterium sp.]
MTKKEIRAQAKSFRETITTAQLEQASVLIANQLLQLPIWDKQHFHVFLSIERLKEVDTEPILALLMGKNKTIYISKTNLDTYQMTPVVLEDTTRIELNPWGIPEPVNGQEVDPKILDVILVPLVGFDLQGNRVGYGKGFYDRFLERTRMDALKIGLCWLPPVESITDVSPQDIKMDGVVTPEGLWRFGSLVTP